MEAAAFGRHHPNAPPAPHRRRVLVGADTECRVLRTALAAADTGAQALVVAEVRVGVDDGPHRTAAGCSPAPAPNAACSAPPSPPRTPARRRWSWRRSASAWTTTRAWRPVRITERYRPLVRLTPIDIDDLPTEAGP
ncbi:hypothetical protein [Streptomyces argyrophylli]|uniref:hypothetical protein n=1 Tax=Streptomyces argyrophylli TaxID=2726118 RepID=UPI002017C7B9|nr:hypothetical protein [Streptomyces argyrophyllae]